MKYISFSGLYIILAVINTLLLSSCNEESVVVPKENQTELFAKSISQDIRYNHSEVTIGEDSIMYLKVEKPEDAQSEFLRILPDDIAAVQKNTPHVDDGIDTLSYSLYNATTGKFDNVIYCCYKNNNLTTSLGLYGWVILPPSISDIINAKIIMFVGASVHLSFGDSITEQSLWQSMFKEYANTSLEIIKGYSGQALWSNCTNSALNNKLGKEPFDFITVMFGTNDWGQSRSIGTISDINPNGEYTGTFYGSLNTFLENITTMFSDKVIVVVTPPYGSEDYDYNMQPFSDDGEKNLLGLTIRDYADAIVMACKKWNVPCYDFNAECGWNINNRSVYLTADANGTFIHPNIEGANMYAKKLAEYWTKLQLSYTNNKRINEN